MNSSEAIDGLDVQKWKSASAQQKLALLREVQNNLGIFAEQLINADCKAKKIKREDPKNLHQEATSIQGTVVLFGINLNAYIDLYKSLGKGRMPSPKKTEKVKGAKNLYDITVFPHTIKDYVMYFDRTDKVRVKRKIQRKNPLEKKGGIIGIIGAGNYSSPIEILGALFLENCVATYKAHPLNEKSNHVWQKILKPLVDFDALSFYNVNDGKKLAQNAKLKKIYFTGSNTTAKAIMAETKTPLISECGGNNPCIVVPGKKPWTLSQIQHQTEVIATMAKLNGGAVCGRPQTLITCKNWPQRPVFLDTLKHALDKGTPATTSYYPNSEKLFNKFKKKFPDAEILTPENNTLEQSEFLFTENVPQKSFATQNEAFCQIMNEVTLNTPPAAEKFLKSAVKFSNEDLAGTLTSTIIIDNPTAKHHKKALDNAITDLRYGSVGINVMPPIIFMNPYLTWGGNEKGREFFSGTGNFGNLLNLQNIEKSIAVSPFWSPGHFKTTNKSAWLNISKQAAKYAIHPTWWNMIMTAITIIKDKLKPKDF